MKTIKLIAIGIFLFVANTMQSQVSVNVNLGSPPAWGPTGYSNVEYYYLPDVQAYYDIRSSQFIHYGNGKWVRTTYLPRRYRNYDLYNGYKVVLTDYHGSRPYSNFKNHKVKYYKGYRGKAQKNIGKHDRDDDRNDRHDDNYDNGKSNKKNKGKSHGKHD